MTLAAPTFEGTSIDDKTMVEIIAGEVAPPRSAEISDVLDAIAIGYALIMQGYLGIRKEPGVEEKTPPPKDYFHRALELLGQQEHPDPDQVFQAHYYMGGYLGATGRHKEALRYAERCQQVWPNRYEGTRLAASALAHLGNEQRARSLYLRSLGQELSQEGLIDMYLNHMLHLAQRIIGIKTY